MLVASSSSGKGLEAGPARPEPFLADRAIPGRPLGGDGGVPSKGGGRLERKEWVVPEDLPAQGHEKADGGTDGHAKRFVKMGKQKGKPPMDSIVGGGSWVVRCDRCGELLSLHRTESEAHAAPQICLKHKK